MAEIEMKPLKKSQLDHLTHRELQQDSNDPEEVVVPSVAALIAMLLLGLLYLVLPPNVIIGPNWLLLVIEGVFLIPLVIDLVTTWNLSHTARRMLVLVYDGIRTVALVDVVFFSALVFQYSRLRFVVLGTGWRRLLEPRQSEATTLSRHALVSSLEENFFSCRPLLASATVSSYSCIVIPQELHLPRYNPCVFLARSPQQPPGKVKLLHYH